MDFHKTYHEEEKLYLAGPECFYPDGRKKLQSMKLLAESYGFGVSLPNDNKLDMSNEDVRKNADNIFENCAVSIDITTAILVDLERFRGSEPDGGSIYELGMAYARGCRCYGYTRDLRPVYRKYDGAMLKDGVVYDRDDKELAYPELPFSPNIIGSSKVIEGDLDDCLKLLMLDIKEERKAGITRTYLDEKPGPKNKKAKTIYLSLSNRYSENKGAYEKLEALAKEAGYKLVISAIPKKLAGIKDVYRQAAEIFAQNEKAVKDSDICLFDLNDYHGWEPNSDVAFEAGMAWQLGKKCFGFMGDNSNMRTRIPHYDDKLENRDWHGNDVENFNYPLNLMFSSSMPIFGGDVTAAFKQVLKHISR
ncbi:MAG: nucleoside 2-deoxyribosyltransferase [Erysipelotrichaceae bacterium]|nr:nucleoside 2-deoxyribosyltransferase [Erysipelotrichaceae bacterium]